MRSKITALLAAVVAAAGTAGAAKWARGRKGEDELDLEVGEPLTVEPDEEPQSVAPVSPAGTAGTAAAEDLTAIKGLGQVKAAKLVAAGVTSYAQIANWNEDDIAEFGLKTNTSPGQIKREDWMGQARALTASE